MPEFSLPHDHGAHGHTEDLYRELKTWSTSARCAISSNS